MANPHDVQSSIGIAAPPSFADNEYGALLRCVQAHCGASGQATELRTFSEAWNGLAYRYLAARGADDAYTSSIQRNGTMPPPSERLVQERELFEFFTCALSAIETLGRGLDTVGRMAGGGFTTKPRPYPKDVAKAYKATYPTEPLTAALDALVSDSLYEELCNVRNALSHGGTPPRQAHLNIGSPPTDPEWGKLTIDTTTTRRFKDWLDRHFTAIMREAAAFARARL